MSKEIGDDYSSSLADLTMNSKPLINMLTILADENIKHAAVIVQSVETHLDQVGADIKLPVLYLVDSIIKNVGGVYTQLFSQSIVGMFCRVFKQVDEKTRSQMFKLRETWHDVFPSIKLYQLDVKVNLIDPAWPIQAQPPQSGNIHVNPNFFKNNPSNSPLPSTSASVIAHTPDEEEMRNAVALKEQELILLQKRKVELELEQTKKLLEQTKSLEKKATVVNSDVPSGSLSSAVVVPARVKRPQVNLLNSSSVGSLRIAPVNSALINRVQRRDPRLSRDIHHVSDTNSASQLSSQSDIKIHSKSDKSTRFSKSFEIHVEQQNKDDKVTNRPHSNKKDPRLNRNKHLETSARVSKSSSHKRPRTPTKINLDHRSLEKREKLGTSPETIKISQRIKLPPIPKIKMKNTDEVHKDGSSESNSPNKKNSARASNSTRDKSKKSKSSNDVKVPSPEKAGKNISPKKNKFKPLKYTQIDVDPASPPPTDVTFKELKTSTKERNYIRRNREKSESPDKVEESPRTVQTSLTTDNKSVKPTAVDVIGNGVTKKDVDFRLIAKTAETTTAPITKKRHSSDKSEDLPSKKSKSEKFDALFGDEDVDLRKLIVEKLPSPSPPLSVNDDDEPPLNFINNKMEGNWAKVKEVQSPQVETPSKAQRRIAEFVEATKNKDALGRPFLFKHSLDLQFLSNLNPEDIDMRQRTLNKLDGDALNTTIETILAQAEENLRNGEMDKEQYNILIRQVLQLNETQKLKEAQQKDSFETSRKKLNWITKHQNAEPGYSNEESDGANSPNSDIIEDNGDSVQQSFSSTYGDIDERVAPPLVSQNEGGKRPPLLPRPDARSLDSDLRMPPQMPTFDNQDGKFMPRGPDMRFPGRHMGPRMFGSKGWRGMRPRMEERGGFRGMNSRGLLPAPNARRMPMNNRAQFDPNQASQYLPNNIPIVEPRQITNPICPYVSDGSFSPPPLGTPSADKGFPPVDPNIIEFIEYDTMKTIQIDGAAREIRYYDKTAVIMLNWDDPREISFAPGQRRIHFDDESYVLNLHDDYINVNVDGQPHRICFGGPTREVFIDESWFECFFGGPPVPIMLDNKVKYIKLDGPPPQVNIGKVKRTDLVAGKINLIVDGTTMLPVFLDAKPQKFDIEHVTHTLRFVDSLQTILINEKPYKVEFGGLPKPLFVGKKKHFIRFSVLPQGIKSGCVNIRNMDGKKPAILPTPEFNSAANPEQPNQNLGVNDSHYQSLPIKLDNFANSGSVSGGLDVLASVMPSSMAPASQFSGYSIAEPLVESNTKTTIIPGLSQHQDMSVPPPNISSLLQTLNVNDLFAKLVASGIVTNLPSATTNQKVEVEETTLPNNISKPAEKSFGRNQSNTIKPVNLMKSETLKVRQPGLVASLHTGMQCGGCGARFPPEHTVRYSQHLDWHFRQNRADRHSQRRPNSRRWYYDISDWIQYQEIEDLEEREKNWFEREQQAAEAAKSEEAAVVAARREQSSVPLKSGAPPEQLRCHLCHDNFDQFYNHDIDEWHLRNAVEYEGNNYHPLCLDDYKLSLIKEQEQSYEEEENKDNTLIDIDKEINDAETNENDDASEMKTMESIDETNDQDNESIVEVLSEEANTQESTLDTAPDVEVVEEDDDVVIKNEPVEQIIVDDVDTDEETERERQARNVLPDGVPIDFANIKIKQEPIDPDDEPIITSEGIITTQADTTSVAVLSSIDGNVQFEPTDQAVPNIPAGGIKINITKPIVSLQPKEKEVVQPAVPQDSSNEPCPPGEEPEILYKLKPNLEGISFEVQPPCNRGVEMSGLCSIM